MTNNTIKCAGRGGFSLPLILHVIFLSLLLPFLSCSKTALKQKKCAEAREKIIELSVTVEKSLGRMAPEKERWSKEEIRKAVESRLDPEGEFIENCVKDLPDQAVDCIIKSKKLAELDRCMK
ncbi:MAG: hypothetical protein ABIJ56_15030 [Pseudomonadota bacterium]